MRSITGNNRRATRDIDLDLIHYPIDDESIREFVQRLNCISGITIGIVGGITELKHQDYHGRSIEVEINDDLGNVVRSKIDIGVHKHLEIEQEEYCFDVCMDEKGVSLLKNTAEQAFVEKLRSLLIFGLNSRRYKDIYDMFYLRTITRAGKIQAIITHLIYEDAGMREGSIHDIIRRVSGTFKDERYLNRVSSSRQRWLDDDIHDIADGIVTYLVQLKG